MFSCGALFHLIYTAHIKNIWFAEPLLWRRRSSVRRVFLKHINAKFCGKVPIHIISLKFFNFKLLIFTGPFEDIVYYIGRQAIMFLDNTDFKFGTREYMYWIYGAVCAAGVIIVQSTSF